MVQSMHDQRTLANVLAVSGAGWKNRRKQFDYNDAGVAKWQTHRT